MMMSVDTLSLPLQPLKHYEPNHRVLSRTASQLQGLTAIDNRSKRRRPGRQLSEPALRLPARDPNSVVIRPMTKEHLGKVADLMRREGWNVDFDNMAAVFHMQPQYFFVAVTPYGQVVGHCSACHLDDKLGMLSYLLVSSTHQQLGLGSKLMKQAVGALEGRTVCFYSVEDAIPFYERRGFQTRRFRALVRDFSLDPRDFASVDMPENIQVVPSKDVPFNKLCNYDTGMHNGIERPDYFKNWIVGPQNISFTALDTDTGKVLGYLSLSFANGRWDLNPLYADSDEIAMYLLKKASEHVGEPIRVFVRIPADFASGIKLFNKMRDTQHYRVLYLMSDRPLPDISSDKIYSLSTVCYGLV